MKGAIDISYWELTFGFTILIIPILLFWYYKIQMIKDLLFNSLRMVVQLALVAVYLEWIFTLNNAWLNLRKR